MKFRTILATLLFAALPLSVINAQSIRSVNTEVVLNYDGSAEVTQTWDVEVVSGTEWYIPVSNLGKMTLTDFSVSENGKEYINEGRNWDTDRSLSQKAGRCGIVDNGSSGVELCWGQGNYGRHVWVCKYHLTGLVQSLEDYDAFNYQFVNPGLIATPRSASIRFINNTGTEDWTPDNTRVWGFGFEGEINVANGEIIARLERRMESMITMVRFDKMMFEPAVSRNISFEDMQKKAFRKSSYSDGDDGILFGILMVLILLLFFGYFLYMVLALLTGHKYKKNLFGQSKITEWYREAPLEGNIPAAWYVLCKGYRFTSDAKPNNLVGTYFLKWILDGYMTVRQDPDKRKKVSLAFTDAVPEFSCNEEKELYEWTVEASGDKVLESSEFKKWSKSNSEKLVQWPEQIKNAGFAYLANNKFLSGTGKGTPEHQAELRNVIAFKNFLNDFTLSSEREAQDVKLWKSYLIYAQMFGIADKVASQFKKLYPDFFQEIAQTTGLDAAQLYYLIRWNNSLSNVGYSNAIAGQGATVASGGFGGPTSFGGGGGFSGGGFGGGSR